MKHLLLIAALALPVLAQDPDTAPCPTNFAFMGAGLSSTGAASAPTGSGAAAYGRKLLNLSGRCLYSVQGVTFTGGIFQPSYKITTGALVRVLWTEAFAIYAGVDLGIANGTEPVALPDLKTLSLETVTQLARAGGGFVTWSKFPERFHVPKGMSAVFGGKIAATPSGSQNQYTFGVVYGWGQ